LKQLISALILCVIMAGVMHAQNVVGGVDDSHGVFIGGTPDQPTIVNHSDKPILAWAVNENFVGYSEANWNLDMNRLAKGTPVLPGEERSLGISQSFFTNPGGRDQVLGYSLLAVLFADGSFVGTDYWRQEFSNQLYKRRSLARDFQYLSDKYRLMEEDRNMAREHGKRIERGVMAHVLLVIREDEGEQAAEAALARLASLPDVKGENQ
jgi:hypothetical protein